MENRYETLEELLAAVRESGRPLQVTVWGPDGRFSRVRSVEIHNVGFTQIERKRFQGWAGIMATDMVIDYLASRFEVSRAEIYMLDIDETWTDEKWHDHARKKYDAQSG